MHYVWSRWPAWSGSSCDRLQCTVPGSTSPTLSGISPAAIIAYFSGTCKPRRRFPPPFSAVLTTTLPALLPMAYAADFRGRFSTTLIAVPSAFCCWLPLLFPSADPSRLRRRPIGISDILCFGLFTKSYHRTLRRFLRCEIFAGSRCRFLRCGPLSGTAAEIFTGSLGATRVLWKLPAGGCPTFGAPVFSICYRWCRSIPKPHF